MNNAKVSGIKMSSALNVALIYATAISILVIPQQFKQEVASIQRKALAPLAIWKKSLKIGLFCGTNFR
ncbi:MAG: hypothetical protein Q7U04_16190 [Bacteriovorax sp.]|nr:hypothetical protein [Bacteriovorax sp.]